MNQENLQDDVEPQTKRHIDRTKLNASILVALILVNFACIFIYSESLDAVVRAKVTYNDSPFVGWVEIMNPTGEYIEPQAKYLFKGSYVSEKEYSVGRKLYLIAWVDLGLPAVKGLRVDFTVSHDTMSIELTEGQVWFYPKNESLPFGM